MTTTTELLQQALDALENSSDIVFKDIKKAHLRESAIDAIRAHLAAPMPADEWVMVPRVPTKAMMDAGREPWPREKNSVFGAPDLLTSWDYMIEAAPPTPKYPT